MANVLQFPALYEAKAFTAGEFKVSGTLCGCIDVATPGPTFCLTPDEAFALAQAILHSREDVLANSRPFSDPRLVKGCNNG